MESLNINGIDYPKATLSKYFLKTLNSSILQKRNEKYLENLKLKEGRNVTLFGIHFDNRAEDIVTKLNKTNVKYYLKKENCLIIYNENFKEYVGKRCGGGNGNGFLRNYRSDTTDSCSAKNRSSGPDKPVNAFIYGIPTGIYDIPDNIEYQDIINDAISQIIKCINNNQKIDYVIWCIQKINDTDYSTIYNMKQPDKSDSSEDLDTKIIRLGLDTFNNINSLKAAKYISDILFKIFKERKYYFSNRDIINTDGTVNNEHKYFNTYFETKYSTDVTPDMIISPTVPSSA
jgi:hypothetical protein